MQGQSLSLFIGHFGLSEHQALCLGPALGPGRDEVQYGLGGVGLEGGEGGTAAGSRVEVRAESTGAIGPRDRAAVQEAPAGPKHEAAAHRREESGRGAVHREQHARGGVAPCPTRNAVGENRRLQSRRTRVARLPPAWP